MYEYRAIVRRVVDGDTVDVDVDLGFGIWKHNTRIRLIGVDTPEIRTRDAREKKYGYLAKSFVESYFPVDSSLTIRTYIDSNDKFGRVLAELFTDNGVNFNDLLIEKRYGVTYTGQSKDDIEAQHQANFDYLDTLFT